jgi:hypothetical protein
VALNEPDFVPFLVLDADASQSYAINCGVRGADLVIDGPPGTGKSQTIANLIATLSARGERILFVAEKRAAIDAVLDRLSRVGLADLVLDIHDGAGSRRRLAADLARTLAIAGGIPKPDMTGAQETLIRRRQVLIDRAASMKPSPGCWESRLRRHPRSDSGEIGSPASAIRRSARPGPSWNTSSAWAALPSPRRRRPGPGPLRPGRSPHPTLPGQLSTPLTPWPTIRCLRRPSASTDGTVILAGGEPGE